MILRKVYLPGEGLGASEEGRAPFRSSSLRASEHPGEGLGVCHFFVTRRKAFEHLRKVVLLPDRRASEEGLSPSSIRGKVWEPFLLSDRRACAPVA